MAMDIGRVINYHSFKQSYSFNNSTVMNAFLNAKPYSELIPAQSGLSTVNYFASHNKVQAYKASVQNLNESAKATQKVSDNLLNKDNNLISAKKISTNSDAVTGTAMSGAAVKKYEIKVEQVAKEQHNQSSTVSANGYGAFGNGSFSMSLRNAVGAEKQVNVYIAPEDSNKKALGKIAGAFNRAGLNASISVENGQLKLDVASEKTGAESAFSVQDIKGDLAAKTGLGKVNQKAQDAEFTLDGKDYRQSENKVLLDEGRVSLQLKNKTMQQLSIEVDNDTDVSVKSVKDLVAAINDMRKNTENIALSGKNSLKDFFSEESGNGKMSDIGIYMSADDSGIAVNEVKLRKSINDSPQAVSSMIRGSNGLAAAAKNEAETILNTPVSELLKTPDDLTGYADKNYGIGLGKMQSFRNVQQGMFVDMMA